MRQEIHEFIERWYNLTTAVPLAQRCPVRSAQSQAAQDLADNPLLTHMMAILNQEKECQ
jgi:hypothetical protein